MKQFTVISEQSPLTIYKHFEKIVYTESWCQLCCSTLDTFFCCSTEKSIETSLTTQYQVSSSGAIEIAQYHAKRHLLAELWFWYSKHNITVMKWILHIFQPAFALFWSSYVVVTVMFSMIFHDFPNGCWNFDKNEGIWIWIAIFTR